MNKLIAYFIKFPIWANAVIVVTAIAGVLSLFIMPKSFFPEMSPNRVYINVAYPGASPKEIEEGITTKVEESLNGIQGVKEITSTSSENISNITVTGIEGIDLDKMLQDVKNAVDGINQFPAGAEKPLVFAQTSRGMGGLSNVVGFYSLYGRCCGGGPCFFFFVCASGSRRRRTRRRGRYFFVRLWRDRLAGCKRAAGLRFGRQHICSVWERWKGYRRVLSATGQRR